MNPLTNMRNVKKLSERELQNLPKSSWHDEYKSSAWIFVGGLPYDLSEGDIMAIFSQYGEITNLNLVRDKDTGKQKGFCFICYEDQRSTVLSVDNFNGTRVLGRILRVDHVKDYKPPKSSEPTNKIKKEKVDDFIVKSEFKTEIKQEIHSPQIKREICTPEIKTEICTPEIKREVCTPKIISSPNDKNNKSKRKSKDQDKIKHNHYKSSENYKDYNHQIEKSKEKDRKKHYKSTCDKSYERGRSNKRRSSSKEQNISKDSSIKSNKKPYFRDSSKEKDKKQFSDRKEHKHRDSIDIRNKRKQ